MNTAMHTTPGGISPGVDGASLFGSGVSWAAVFAGAVVAAAMALILLALGAGLGLSTVSPWAGAGVSATALGVGAMVWLLAVQIISSGLGGYIAGRLRGHWAGVHTDEVYFRDTAHGLLAWSVAAIVGASLLTGAAGALVSAAGGAATTAVGATAAAAGTAAGAAAGSLPTGYVTDVLQRSDNPPAPQDPAASTAEIGRIVALSVANGNVSADDRMRLTKLVAQRTGLSETEAQARVDQVVQRAITVANEAKEKAKAAADTSRKVAAGISLWIFVSLLSGAFSASLLATYGGRLRDRVAGTPYRA